MSWETDTKRAYELYPEIQKNNGQACAELIEIMERHARGVVRKQLAKYNLYDTDLEQEILTEGCVQVYRKMAAGFEVSAQEFKAEDFLYYCMGIYRTLAVKYGSAKIDELVHNQSLEETEEAGGFVKARAGADTDPFEAFLRKEEFTLIGQIIHLYMSEFFDFKREPYMMLCLGYSKILSHIIGDENKDNAIDWAFQMMADQNIGQLSWEFRDKYNQSDRSHQYDWGERYQNNLKKPYQLEAGDLRSIADLVLTSQFDRKDASQWCIRVNTAIVNALAKKVMDDEVLTELLMDYADFRLAVNKAKQKKKKAEEK